VHDVFSRFLPSIVDGVLGRTTTASRRVQTTGTVVF
jgi:hypothetical protein